MSALPGVLGMLSPEALATLEAAAAGTDRLAARDAMWHALRAGAEAAGAQMPPLAAQLERLHTMIAGADSLMTSMIIREPGHRASAGLIDRPLWNKFLVPGTNGLESLKHKGVRRIRPVFSQYALAGAEDALVLQRLANAASEELREAATKLLGFDPRWRK